MLLNSAYQYQLYEMAHAALVPARAFSDATYFLFRNPFNPFAATPFGRNMAAGAELFERITRRYGKPMFGFNNVVVDGVEHEVVEEVVWSRPFCNLLHFARPTVQNNESQPSLLIVAPMSGHYATLLRGTVEAFLPTHRVYITDWADARMAPLALGRFDLDDYVDYLREMLQTLGPGVHTIGVCQPAVPLLAAVALMEAADSPDAPASMTLMGGPIDTRKSLKPRSTSSPRSAASNEFRSNCLQTVPFPLSRLRPPGLSRLPAAFRLHGDEYRPPRQRPSRHVPPPRPGRRRFRREAPRVL